MLPFRTILDARTAFEYEVLAVNPDGSVYGRLLDDPVGYLNATRTTIPGWAVIDVA